MIDQIFNEIKEEARNSNISIKDDSIVRTVRVGFNVVEPTISNSLPNFYINDKDQFHKILNEYVLNALDFYDLSATYENIKKILTFVWSNITNDEMNSIDKYISKYTDFISDNKLQGKKGFKSTSLGSLNYSVLKQSIQQETPYCFQSYFENPENLSKYALPRISFGISDNICYIYAIQNKDCKINTDSKYNLKVKDAFSSINSGIKKYRNVTPSFVVALSLFLSFLKENNIFKVRVQSPLPIRILNRKLVTEYRIKLETMKANLNEESLEIFKKELIDKKITNDYNSTTKFVNCFNRLKLHFENIFLSKTVLEENMILEIINLKTKYSLLKEITESENIYNEKER